MSGLLLSLLLSQVSYSPGEAQAIFAEGVEAYGRDDAPGAEAAFRKLLEHGMGGADVEYNLGTVELAQGKLGEAVLAVPRWPSSFHGAPASGFSFSPACVVALARR